MQRRVALATVVILLAGCGDAVRTAPPVPTEEEASAYLRSIVELARAGDLEGMCAIGFGLCRDQLEESGGAAAVPGDPPRIAGSVEIPNQPAGNGWQAGGRLFVLCGVDGLGRAYRTELLVFRDPGGGLLSTNTVYWSGYGIGVTRGGVGVEESAGDAFGC